jgi:hypothetical protein
MSRAAVVLPVPGNPIVRNRVGRCTCRHIAANLDGSQGEIEPSDFGCADAVAPIVVPLMQTLAYFAYWLERKRPMISLGGVAERSNVAVF